MRPLVSFLGFIRGKATRQNPHRENFIVVDKNLYFLNMKVPNDVEMAIETDIRSIDPDSASALRDALNAGGDRLTDDQRGMISEIIRIVPLIFKYYKDETNLALKIRAFEEAKKQTQAVVSAVRDPLLFTPLAPIIAICELETGYEGCTSKGRMLNIGERLLGSAAGILLTPGVGEKLVKIAMAKATTSAVFLETARYASKIMAVVKDTDAARKLIGLASKFTGKFSIEVDIDVMTTLLETGMVKDVEAAAVKAEKLFDSAKKVGMSKVDDVKAWASASSDLSETRLTKVISESHRITPASSVQKVSPDVIKFSQSNVNDAAEITASMRSRGWVGDPIDVVKISDGTLVTVDNTRVLAASRANIDVEAIVRSGSESLSTQMAERFTTSAGVPKTWEEAVKFRIGNQNRTWSKLYPNGSYVTKSLD